MKPRKEVCIRDTSNNLHIVPYFFAMRGGCVITASLREEGRYVITHIASGYTVATGFTRRGLALLGLKTLTERVANFEMAVNDWIENKIVTPEIEQIRAIIRELKRS